MALFLHFDSQIHWNGNKKNHPLLQFSSLWAEIRRAETYFVRHWIHFSKQHQQQWQQKEKMKLRTYAYITELHFFPPFVCSFADILLYYFLFSLCLNWTFSSFLFLPIFSLTLSARSIRFFFLFASVFECLAIIWIWLLLPLPLLFRTNKKFP